MRLHTQQTHYISVNQTDYSKWFLQHALAQVNIVSTLEVSP